MATKKTKKAWYESKTIWIALLTGVMGIITAVETEYKLPGLLITAKSLIDMWLRLNTTDAIE